MVEYNLDPIDPEEEEDLDNENTDEEYVFEVDLDNDGEEVLEDNDEETDEDDSEDEDDDKKDKDSMDNNMVLSKHKIQGKHSLKYDSIFKGKKEEPLSDEEFGVSDSYHNENFEVDRGSMYWFESIDNENYVKSKRIKEKVYEVLSENTDINFLNNRRKPSKADFNNYYFLLKTNLKDENFSNVELFNELAVYFSDNLLNMFKLLDNKWRNIIIEELQEHIGKYKPNMEVSYRNISIGTEVEFLFEDEEGIKHITGVVKSIEETIFKVDSYVKIYSVTLDEITKILNNNKFKYNLNKLNNIDFL